MARMTKPRKKTKKKRSTRPRRKVCPFCADTALTIDYKNVTMLERYVTERGKIVPRRISGICSSHQRRFALAVKRARHIALLPYTVLGN